MERLVLRTTSNTRRYRRTPKGVLTNMYDHMRSRHQVYFTLAEFHDRYLEDGRYVRLFSEWASGGYKKLQKPSLDRINRAKPYTVANTQMMTWEENRFKQNMERRSRKGPVIQYKEGIEVARYRSQREAVKKTGLTQGLVSEVLNRKRPHTGGFTFRYEDAELMERAS